MARIRGRTAQALIQAKDDARQRRDDAAEEVRVARHAVESAKAVYEALSSAYDALEKTFVPKSDSVPKTSKKSASKSSVPARTAQPPSSGNNGEQIVVDGHYAETDRGSSDSR